MVLSGKEPPAAHDTVATSSCGLNADPFIHTGIKSDKTFKGAMGHTVGTLANGYIKSAPLPRVTARAAHVTAVTNRCQALTPVPYGLAPVPLSSPMTEHRFSHESESLVQPLIMRQVACHTSSQYLPRIQHTVLIN